jgi:hypothetical protein
MDSILFNFVAPIPMRVAVAEARAAIGDMNGAREALAVALQAIDTRAGKIPDLVMRACYLNEIPEHVRARDLARDGFVTRLG